MTPTPRWASCLSWTMTPSLPTPEQIALARLTEGQQLEVHLPQVLAQGPNVVRAELERHRVRVAAATGLLPGAVLHQPLDLQQLHRGLGALHLIGCPTALLLLDHRTISPYAQSERDTAARLREVATIASEYGIVLAVEALGTPNGHLPRYGHGPEPGLRALPQVDELLDLLGSELPRVGICVDSVSWAATGANPTHLTGLRHPVRHVRIADVPHRLPALRWGTPQRLLPGDGALNWEVFAHALAQEGYDGPLAMAVTNPIVRALPGREIAARATTATRHVRAATHSPTANTGRAA